MTPEYLSRILSQTPRFFQTPRILSGIWLKFWNFEALIWAESGVILFILFEGQRLTWIRRQVQKNDVFGTQAKDIFCNHTDNSNICLRIPPLEKIWFSFCNFWKRLPVGSNLSGESVCMIMHDHFGGSFWSKHNHLVVTRVCQYPQKMHYHPVQQEQHSIWSPQWWGGGSEVWIYLIGGSNHVAHLQPIIFRLSSSPSTRGGCPW